MTKNGQLVLFLLVVPSIVTGDCTCECDPGQEDHNKLLALKYKLGAITSILVAGAIGVGIPVLGKAIPALQPEKDIFFIVKAFAAGVILSTAFIHVLPHAFESLTSPCLNENPWGKFPFTGFVAMVSAIGTLMIDCFATSYYSNRRKKEVNAVDESGDEEKSRGDEAHSHGHSHGRMLDDAASSQLLRHRVIAQVLEMGIVAHSLIIGISMGASESAKTVRPLMAALTFHQFFEGMGLGSCISQAKLKGRAMLIMGLFFSLTTPVGIAIGIGISQGYNEDSPTALIVQGIFDASSAGILIYMSLVDLLAADFMHPKVQSNGKLQFGVNFFLLFGAACMSILAKWA